MGKLTKKRANEMQIARGRLKGALQVLANLSDEEDSGSESEKKIPAQGRTRGRPPKKIAKPNSPPPTEPQHMDPAERIHESFVMKLFDRSLDLAKYDEHTPLYPICRAWLINQPGSNAIKSYRNRRSVSPQTREKNKGILKKVLNGSVVDVTSLPAPKSLDIPRVPSPTPDQKKMKKENVDINYNIEAPSLSKEELLDLHKKRWLKVRNKWNAHSKASQQKYILSHEILEAIYKPMQ